jgi:type II secretory pathway pseudopilin PulG
MNTWRARRSAGGFTYIGVLVLVAVMGLWLAAAGQVWHTMQRREKEQELLFVGNQFRLALMRYAANAHGQARAPLQLEDLLKDPRSPGVQRYLRKIYRDPVTGTTDWGLVTGPNGEIYGVYSRSDEEPLKKDGFALADRAFEGRMKYSEWVFMGSSVKSRRLQVAPPAVPGSGAAPGGT